MNIRIRYHRTKEQGILKSNVFISPDGVSHEVFLYTNNTSGRISSNNSSRVLDFSAKSLSSLKKIAKDRLSDVSGVVFLDETRISKKQRDLMKDSTV